MEYSGRIVRIEATLFREAWDNVRLRKSIDVFEGFGPLDMRFLPGWGPQRAKAGAEMYPWCLELWVVTK
jgi:hypothetical protein